MQAIKRQVVAPIDEGFSKPEQDLLGRHLWARGYFVATSGNVTDEVIAKYIEEQDVDPGKDDDFKVSE